MGEGFLSVGEKFLMGHDDLRRYSVNNTALVSTIPGVVAPVSLARIICIPVPTLRTHTSFQRIEREVCQPTMLSRQFAFS